MEYQNPFSKEATLAGATSRAKKEKLARKKGQDAEKKALAELCKQIGREPGKQDRQNNQRREGGGLSICDITVKGLDGWHCENKAENNYRFPAYWKQLREDCPKDKRPALIFTTNEGERFLQIRLKDLANLAQDILLAAGFDII